MATYVDEAIVLRTVKLAEADRIATMLTQRHGKIRAVVKGVRRTKSRFGARLEPFMRVNVVIARGRSLDIVSQAQSVQAYTNDIIGDYTWYAVANVLVETADRIVGDEEAYETAQYRLLAAALHATAHHSHPASCIAYSYVLRAMALAGWLPRLNTCVLCGSPKELAFACIPAGGVVCALEHHAAEHDHVYYAQDTHTFYNNADDNANVSDCVPSYYGEKALAHSLLPLSDRALAQLSALLQGNWDMLEHYSDDHRLDDQTVHFISQWAQYYLEHPIRSLQLLHS